MNLCAIVSKHTQTLVPKNRNENISQVFFLFNLCSIFSQPKKHTEQKKTHKCIVGPRLNGWEIEIHWNWDQRVRQNEQRWHKTSNNKQFKKEFSVEIISNDIYRVLLSLVIVGVFFPMCWFCEFRKRQLFIGHVQKKERRKTKEWEAK